VREVLWTLAPVGVAGLVALSVGGGLAPLAARGPLVSALVCALVTLLGTGMGLLVWWRRQARLVAASAPPAEAPACAPLP
jgi:hypothetical protein